MNPPPVAPSAIPTSPPVIVRAAGEQSSQSTHRPQSIYFSLRWRSGVDLAVHTGLLLNTVFATFPDTFLEAPAPTPTSNDDNEQLKDYNAVSPTKLSSVVALLLLWSVRLYRVHQIFTSLQH